MDPSREELTKISQEKIWISVRKAKHKRETEYLLMAAQNNDIKTNYVKAEIDKTQEDRKGR